MRTRKNIKDPNISPFLGILEGKRKKAKAEAAAKIEQERQNTFLLKLEAARQGYDPDKTAANQAIQLEETTQGSDNNLYLTVGVIVVVVMAGLYFIKKK